MRVSRLVAFMVVLTLPALGCVVDADEETAPEEVASPIRSGTVDTTTYTSVVSVNVPIAGGNLQCTGIVVAPARILTAAHCLDSRTAMPTATVGGTVYTALTATPHPSYNSGIRYIWHPDLTESNGVTGTFVGADIAILTFSSSLPVPAMQLASSFPGYPGTLTAVGFGESGTGTGLGTRRYAGVTFKFPIPTVSSANVQLHAGGQFYLVPTTPGGAITCAGDSGGPLLDGAGRVAAVISGGNTPGAYTCGSVTSGTATHVAGFQHWILGTTSPHQNTALRYDVNNDGAVAPLDSLVIINYLNSGGQNPPPGSGGPYYRDVNADTFVSSMDVNQINNVLNWSAAGRVFSVTTTP